MSLLSAIILQLAIALPLVVAQQEPSKFQDKLATDLSPAASTRNNRLLASSDQISGPTMTSVHQVWTTASTGNIDELSPELINKLRSNVPFLAAYATRPRIVGPVDTQTTAEFGDKLKSGSNQLQTAASSRQENLLPRLGDFSEFNVETSSLSKSEHRQNKKTSLKRKQIDEDAELIKLRRKPSGTSSRSKRRKSKSSRRKSSKKHNRLRLSAVSKSKLQLASTDDTKGGSRVDREPFYSTKQAKKPKEIVDEPSEDVPIDGESDLPSEPKRVGDDDVDEGGDTVTVMPKFDGVDDDPALPGEDDEADEADLPENEAEDGGTDFSGGGGVGATTVGSGSGPNSNKEPGSSERPFKPGVEFADDGRGPTREDDDGNSSPKRKDGDGSDRDDDARPPAGNDSRDDGIDSGDDSDVDYRDESDSSEGKGKRKGAGRDHKEGAQPGHSNKGDDCDDGSYDHHGHDPIEWLQKSVPGEPGVDYPILSRPNTTNFNCRDQKYPGYYADVDARCQVFHICQADGRQDSFLCPNGTIFSQISLVCVWWNSFDCEDAPKLYDLNALLYKKSARGPTNDQDDLKPRPGRRFRPEIDADEDDSSVDSLIKSMRRFKETDKSAENDQVDDDESYNPGKTSRPKGNGLDESSVQRKSTEVEDESLPDSQVRDSSRLRARSEPRRKRASAKHTPPKLRSRRRKQQNPRRKANLRHNIKPRRRA